MTTFEKLSQLLTWVNFHSENGFAARKWIKDRELLPLFPKQTLNKYFERFIVSERLVQQGFLYISYRPATLLFERPLARSASEQSSFVSCYCYFVAFWEYGISFLSCKHRGTSVILCRNKIGNLVWISLGSNATSKFHS